MLKFKRCCFLKRGRFVTLEWARTLFLCNSVSIFILLFKKNPNPQALTSSVIAFSLAVLIRCVMLQSPVRVFKTVFLLLIRKGENYQKYLAKVVLSLSKVPFSFLPFPQWRMYLLLDIFVYFIKRRKFPWVALWFKMFVPVPVYPQQHSFWAKLSWSIVAEMARGRFSPP